MAFKIRPVFLLLIALTVPLYASRTQPVKPASTEAQHLKDLAALKSAAADQFLITGHGAPRREYTQCERDLASYSKTLKKSGLTLLEAPTCITLEGETESYAPAFRALAVEPVVPTMVLGGRFNSLTYCELETQRMTAQLTAKAKVLEASCKPIKSTDVTASTEGLFQPALIVLETPSDPSLVKRFSSIETLVEASANAAAKTLTN